MSARKRARAAAADDDDAEGGAATAGGGGGDGGGVLPGQEGRVANAASLAAVDNAVGSLAGVLAAVRVCPVVVVCDADINVAFAVRAKVEVAMVAAMRSGGAVAGGGALARGVAGGGDGARAREGSGGAAEVTAAARRLSVVARAAEPAVAYGDMPASVAERRVGALLSATARGLGYSGAVDVAARTALLEQMAPLPAALGAGYAGYMCRAAVAFLASVLPGGRGACVAVYSPPLRAYAPPEPLARAVMFGDLELAAMARLLGAAGCAAVASALLAAGAEHCAAVNAFASAAGNTEPLERLPAAALQVRAWRYAFAYAVMCISEYAAALKGWEFKRLLPRFSGLNEVAVALAAIGHITVMRRMLLRCAREAAVDACRPLGAAARMLAAAGMPPPGLIVGTPASGGWAGGGGGVGGGGVVDLEWTVELRKRCAQSAGVLAATCAAALKAKQWKDGPMLPGLHGYRNNAHMIAFGGAALCTASVRAAAPSDFVRYACAVVLRVREKQRVPKPHARALSLALDDALRAHGLRGDAWTPHAVVEAAVVDVAAGPDRDAAEYVRAVRQGAGAGVPGGGSGGGGPAAAAAAEKQPQAEPS